MVAKSNVIHCEDCEGQSIRLPDVVHDDSEIFCLGCGEKLGTIKSLRERLLALLSDDPNIFMDNDN